jgi:hypothetical protein
MKALNGVVTDVEDSKATVRANIEAHCEILG